MPHAEFVHLHLHTAYSLLDGACRISDVVEKAAALKMPALAMTDHGNLYGAIEFYKEAMNAGVKPIIGCEAYVALGSRHEKQASSAREAAHHLTLLAKDEDGYKNLIKLITEAHLNGFYYKPRIDKELLAAHAKGLIGLSGCLKGEIAQKLLDNQTAGARKAIGEYRDIFGKGDFYLELQRFEMEQREQVNRDLVALSKEFSLPLVATNDVHYVEKEHWHAHDCLICLQTQALLADEKRMRYAQAQFYLRTPDEMRALFPDQPAALKATLEIAEKCNLTLQFGKPLYPNYVPPEGQSKQQYLHRLCAEGLEKRYGISVEVTSRGDFTTPNGGTGVSPVRSEKSQKKSTGGTPVPPDSRKIVERMKFELGVIGKTNYTSYFLIVWDFIHYAKTHGIPVGPGRGSAAGSLVAYLLEITDIDPLRYNLLFERFLNPDRVSPPDIDIDLSDDRRGEVIDYVRKKYGAQNVAQIITFGTLGAKMVVRDVGRVMGLQYSETDRLAKMIPFAVDMTLKKAMDLSPDFKREYQTSETVKQLIDTAFILEGIARNSSTHAAGVVISDRPLTEIVPLTKDDEGNIITQYSMDPLGELGLLKMDFLGLKTLTIIKNAVELIEKTRGPAVAGLDMKTIPMDDPKVFEMLNKANTIGLFQLESGGMRDLCRKMGISRIEDIIALIALYRPGPMDLIPQFTARKNGKEPIEYEHELLKPICEETYGILIYQEQVMQAASSLAGFTLAQSDLLRRAMGKKKKEEMDKQREVFVKGCAKTNGIPKARAERIFTLLEKFAGYGFNKSHSAAYGVVAYQTAYLKANYPVEFLAALLSNEMGNTDKLPVILNEAKEMGITVLPPDVNRSGVKFSVEGGTAARQSAAQVSGLSPQPSNEVIRYGLAAIKNVGTSAVEAILRARNDGGAFKSVEDFCERVDSRSANRKMLESLIKCGAFDSAVGAKPETVGLLRAQMFMGIDRSMARAANIQRDRQRGQTSLFGTLQEEDSAGYVKHSAMKPKPWSESEMLGYEKELLGYYVSGHPLAEHIPVIETYATHNTAQLADLAERTPVRVGGLLAEVDLRIAKQSQKQWAILKLEDLQGVVEALAYPDTFDKYRAQIAKGKAVFVTATVKQEDKPKLTVQEITPLENAPAQWTTEMRVTISAAADADKLERIRAILAQHQGKVPVLLTISTADGKVAVLDTHDHFHVRPSPQLKHDLEERLGEQTVFFKADKTVRIAPRNFSNKARAENSSEE